jgi:hypothetical protein
MFDLAELLLLDLAQMTELFSVEHRTFPFTILRFPKWLPLVLQSWLEKNLTLLIPKDPAPNLNLNLSY